MVFIIIIMNFNSSELNLRNKEIFMWLKVKIFKKNTKNV